MQIENTHLTPEQRRVLAWLKSEQKKRASHITAIIYLLYNAITSGYFDDADIVKDFSSMTHKQEAEVLMLFGEWIINES